MIATSREWTKGDWASLWTAKGRSVYVLSYSDDSGGYYRALGEDESIDDALEDFDRWRNYQTCHRVVWSEFLNGSRIAYGQVYMGFSCRPMS
jgi:hypothetical protein